MFHSVPGVPCAKMERFAGVVTQTCASHPNYSLIIYNRYNIINLINSNCNKPMMICINL